MKIFRPETAVANTCDLNLDGLTAKRAPFSHDRDVEGSSSVTHVIETRDQAKARASVIRAERAAQNQPISHSAALERVAHELGYADWNTASARLANEPEIPLQVGDRVQGCYLGQSFTGSVLAVRSLSNGARFALTVAFDEPVDVVTFESFSAFRSRVNVTISPGGVSFAKTSNGAPHMVVGRAVSG